MKFLLLISFIVSSALAADIIDPKDCTDFPCLIFNDDFDFLDHDVWRHDITMAGGKNWEFQVYVNNRSISYVRDGHLFIKPGLTADWLMSEDALYSEHLDLWGMGDRGVKCTAAAFDGCERTGTADNILSPILSAKLRTVKDFAVRYGRVEIMARMPSGAWLWPAFMLYPKNAPYGGFPASGEIVIAESRGNEDYGDFGNQRVATTLHWGPHPMYNRYVNTTKLYTTTNNASFTEELHKWTVDWTDEKIEISLDDEVVYKVAPEVNFWDMGKFEAENVENPWAASKSKMAPFDQKFYLKMNLAVGGMEGYFPDNVPSNPPKPWNNTDIHPATPFWEGRDEWLPTWQHGEGKISEKAALEVDYIRVYKMKNAEM